MNRAVSSSRLRTFGLAVECAVLYLGIPALYTAGWLPVPVIPLLIVMAGGCWMVLRRQHKISLLDSWRKKVPTTEWRRIFITYAIAFPLLVGLLWLVKPAALWSLMLHRPGIWLVVMFAYPMLSVLPQEVMFRVFFFERYRPLFGQGIGMIALSAAVFSFAHILFHNWLAVVLTLPGGWLFARSYQRTSSFRLVFVEHALYGCAIFTIGYGTYFYKGTLKLFQAQ